MLYRLLMLIAVIAALATTAESEPDPRALFERGWYRRAAAALEARVNAEPNDASSLAMLALAKQELGDDAAAAKYADRAVAADPQSAAAHWAVAALAGDQAQNAGPIHGLGLARRFKKEAETAAKLDPKHVPSLRALVQFHMMAPGLVGGDKKKADALTNEIAAIEPWQGWLARAMVANFREDTVAAAQAYEKAWAAAPERYETRMALAQWLATPWRGPVPRVEKLALDAQAQDPQRAGSYALLAAVYAYQQRWSDLEAILGKAETNVPDSRAAHYQAARQLLADRHDLPRAEKLLREYLAAPYEGGSPPLAAAHWRLGLVLERQGRKDDAIAELDRAVKLDPRLDAAKRDLKRLRG